MPKRRFFFLLIIFTARLFSAPSDARAQGAEYFNLRELSHSNGLAYQWDPILRNAEVTTEKGLFKFHAGSPFALGPRGLEKLSGEVAFREGEVFILGSDKRLLGAQIPLLRVPALNRIKKVVIDAGHGGHDFGAMSPGGIMEKELALRMSKLVARELAGAGIEVIMTRGSDVFVSLSDRPKMANDAGADFFVSVHVNASTSASLNGFEVYYLSEATDDLAVALQHAENLNGSGFADNKALDDDIQTILLDMSASENRRESILAAQAVAGAVEGNVPTAARRIRSAEFRVLKWSRSPSILVEIGYLSNLEDELKLADPLYQKNMAQAVARGILDFKNEFERTNGFTE